jgi:hypothetical protein
LLCCAKIARINDHSYKKGGKAELTLRIAPHFSDNKSEGVGSSKHNLAREAKRPPTLYLHPTTSYQLLIPEIEKPETRGTGARGQNKINDLRLMRPTVCDNGTARGENKTRLLP